MDGREILAHIKLDADLKNIPTVIVSSSEVEADVGKSYDLHANSYVTKPIEFTAFLKLVQSINDYWLTQSKFPPRRNPGALV
jgi:CheY-like chemotaxis protein